MHSGAIKRAYTPIDVLAPLDDKRLCLRDDWKPIQRVFASEDLAFAATPIPCVYTDIVMTPVSVVDTTMADTTDRPISVDVADRPTLADVADRPTSVDVVAGHQRTWPVCIRADMYSVNEEAINGFNPWNTWRH